MENEKVHKHNGQVNIDYSLNPLITYTDFIFGTTNEDGFIIDVCQKVGPTNQMRVISRVGMSRVFAKKFLTEMSRLLAMTEGQLHVGAQKDN